jgi:fructoselysine-6-P-deglycase FrlB-like protein
VSTTIVITATDLALYRRYDGDLEHLSRSTDWTPEFRDAVWRRIEELRQRAYIVTAGLGTAAFAQRVAAEIVECMADEQTRIAFQQLVECDLADNRRSRHAS